MLEKSQTHVFCVFCFLEWKLLAFLVQRTHWQYYLCGPPYSCAALSHFLAETLWLSVCRVIRDIFLWEHLCVLDLPVGQGCWTSCIPYHHPQPHRQPLGAGVLTTFTDEGSRSNLLKVSLLVNGSIRVQPRSVWPQTHALTSPVMLSKHSSVCCF